MKKTFPDFLIVMSDQHSPNALGTISRSAVKTTSLDKIAAKSITFTNAFIS
ncbi:MAG TPA: hypothetical protein PK303_04085 [bacterium]|nr:hypothetical protein [bacterium]HOL34460.1 hypothetical protein [bacterium]HPP08285.1 hypothetical protein [bacterium]